MSDVQRIVYIDNKPIYFTYTPFPKWKMLIIKHLFSYKERMSIINALYHRASEKNQEYPNPEIIHFDNGIREICQNLATSMMES